jgi:hypothetical protein
MEYSSSFVGLEQPIQSQTWDELCMEHPRLTAVLLGLDAWRAAE